jgi:hypothetical protein
MQHASDPCELARPIATSACSRVAIPTLAPKTASIEDRFHGQEGLGSSPDEASQKATKIPFLARVGFDAARKMSPRPVPKLTMHLNRRLG